MKVKAHIRTDKVGSKVEDIIEIPDEELEGYSEADQTEIIDTYVMEWVWNHAEWGWSEVQ
jgi:hypothetical protein